MQTTAPTITARQGARLQPPETFAEVEAMDRASQTRQREDAASARIEAELIWIARRKV